LVLFVGLAAFVLFPSFVVPVSLFPAWYLLCQVKWVYIFLAIQKKKRNLLFTYGFSCEKKSAGIPKEFPAVLAPINNFLRI
jgi:hypothetical protein